MVIKQVKITYSPQLLKNAVKALLAIFFVLFLLTLYERAPHLDDAWLGEHAYWLAKEGKVKSELFNGVLDYEKQLFVYHKFFILSGSIWINLFGWSLVTLKSFSLLWLGVLILLFYKYFKDNQWDSDRLFLALLLLIANPFVLEYAFVFRPEVMLMSIGFGSFLFLDSYLKSGKKYALVVAALLAGLATYTHLNGIIFIIAGGVLLIMQKRIIPGMIFGVVSGLIAALYFLDISFVNGWEVYWQQFTNDPALESSDFKWYTPFWKVLDEHRRFFHDYLEIAYTQLLIICILPLFRRVLKGQQTILVYLIALIVSLAALTQGKTSKYLILYTPYFVLLLAHILSGVFYTDQFKVKKWVLIASCLWYFGAGFYKSGELMMTSVDVAAEHKQLVQLSDVKGEKIMAPMIFIFNEIENYKIKGIHYYRGLHKKYTGKENTYQEIFKGALKYDAGYVLLNKNEIKPLIISHKEAIGYTKIFENQKWLAYKKK